MTSVGLNGSLYNAISVDVEDYFHVAALAPSIPRDSWSSREYRAEASTGKVLEMLASRGVRATFFVLGWVAKRSPELVRAIHRAGHEVACHGMSHELVYKQTRKVFGEETRDSKRLLEDLIGAPVLGYRAASWSITRQSMWALDVILELGFRYDSSVFPIRHDRYGVPGAPQWPGRISTPSGGSLVEFPPSTVRMFGVRVPVAGGGYFRLLPYWITRAGLARINRECAQPFMFYFHPWEVDPEQPRVRASWMSRFRHYTNLQKTEGRLRRLLTEFQCTTVKDVLAHVGLLQAT